MLSCFLWLGPSRWYRILFYVLSHFCCVWCFCMFENHVLSHSLFDFWEFGLHNLQTKHEHLDASYNSHATLCKSDPNHLNTLNQSDRPANRRLKNVVLVLFNEFPRWNLSLTQNRRKMHWAARIVHEQSQGGRGRTRSVVCSNSSQCVKTDRPVATFADLLRAGFVRRACPRSVAHCGRAGMETDEKTWLRSGDAPFHNYFLSDCSTTIFFSICYHIFLSSTIRGGIPFCFMLHHFFSCVVFLYVREPRAIAFFVCDFFPLWSHLIFNRQRVG